MTEPDLPPIERASLHLLQLYDVADSIDLDRAQMAIAQTATPMRPVMTRGANIEIPQLPLEIPLNACAVTVGNTSFQGMMHVRIYDLGILAFRIEMNLPDRVTWEDVTEMLGSLQNYPASVATVFTTAQRAMMSVLSDALLGPYAQARLEDYSILAIEQLGAGISASHLGKNPRLVRVVLGERRPLSEMAMRFATALSYYEDDLILLAWNAAIVIDPDADARVDAAFLLEFANVQLLAFRSYDAQVEHDLARVVPRIARDTPSLWVFSAPSTRYLHEIHQLIAETTESSARVENALKVSEDVYWSRVYMAALAVLRVDVWRSGIAETLSILRETAALLNDEAQVMRQNLLEILVIVLIFVELLVAVISLHR